MSNFLLFVLAFCAVFATIALIIISTELQKATGIIEDLTAGIEELNINVRERVETKK